jgi:hypothetical protein
MNGTHGHNYSNHFVLFCIYIYEHFCTNNTNKKNDFRFIKVKKKPFYEYNCNSFS